MLLHLGVFGTVKLALQRSYFKLLIESYKHLHTNRYAFGRNLGFSILPRDFCPGTSFTYCMPQFACNVLPQLVIEIAYTE